MSDRHTLGRLDAKEGDIITLSYRDKDDQEKRVSVVAIDSFSLSEQMATFCSNTRRSSESIFTENALPAFIEYLASEGLVHVGRAVEVSVGLAGRPAKRLLDEYKYHINPDSFWQEKLTHWYSKHSIILYSGKGEALTLVTGDDGHLFITAEVLSSKGEPLGLMRFSLLLEHITSSISEDDLERIRLAIQSDIALNIPELEVVVDKVTARSNPGYGSNKLDKHFTLPTNRTRKKSMRVEDEHTTE